MEAAVSRLRRSSASVRETARRLLLQTQMLEYCLDEMKSTQPMVYRQLRTPVNRLIVKMKCTHKENLRYADVLDRICDEYTSCDARAASFERLPRQSSLHFQGLDLRALTEILQGFGNRLPDDGL